MDPKSIRREIHRDTISGNVSIYVSGDVEDINELRVVEGKELEESPLKKDGTIVRIFTPEVPLFAIQEKEAHGIDDRHKLEEGSIVNGLELLIEAFILKSEKLSGDVRKRQFYPYVTYDLITSSLTGRLLVSKAIAPAIDREIQIALAHYNAKPAHLKPTCLYCDVIKDPKTIPLSRGGSQHYITHRSEAPEPYSYIVSKQHLTRFDVAAKKIREEMIRELAHSIYDIIERIKGDPSKTSQYDVVHVAFHLAPLHYLQALERIYHPHAEILMGKNGKGDSIIIPGTGWNVILRK